MSQNNRTYTTRRTHKLRPAPCEIMCARCGCFGPYPQMARETDPESRYFGRYVHSEGGDDCHDGPQPNKPYTKQEDPRSAYER